MIKKPIKTARNTVLACAMACTLLGCTVIDHTGAKPLPDLTFNHLKAYSIKGGSTRITQSFKPDEMTRRVSNEFGQSPAFLLKRYANDRFVVDGQNNLPTTFVFNIKTAKLTKNTSDTDPLNFMIGISIDTYNLEVLLELSLMQADGQQAAPHTIYYEQKLVVSSNVTLEEREFAQFEFYERMMSDIDRAISDIIMNKL